MQSPALEAPTVLDPRRIQVLNWNIQKQIKPLWRQDLARLSSEINLALFQEVHLEDTFLACFQEDWCHSFTKGYSTRWRKTGVMTLAQAGHLSHDQLIIREPVFRTPKAVNITTYGLAESDETLLVINLHAVNFSLGMNAYRRQLHGVARALAAHRGPVIFAGDFNAWHPGRERLVREFARRFRLKEVEFEEDHRTRVFGQHLDYMFIQGLRPTSAVIHQVDSSDHNPMLATFSL